MAKIEAAAEEEQGRREVVKEREGKIKSTMPPKKDFTIKEFVEFAISQNPLVYKRLAEI